MRDARELVPLDDEVITCKEYLAIEQLRLVDDEKIDRYALQQLQEFAVGEALYVASRMRRAPGRSSWRLP